MVFARSKEFPSPLRGHKIRREGGALPLTVPSWTEGVVQEISTTLQPCTPWHSVVTSCFAHRARGKGEGWVVLCTNGISWVGSAGVWSYPSKAVTPSWNVRYATSSPKGEGCCRLRAPAFMLLVHRETEAQSCRAWTSPISPGPSCPARQRRTKTFG
uniref:Uncharacterized protein n=1 Tax=Phasianus colchicus TaxID=9054 RepID=A0A669QDZ4_PHACC